METLIKGAKADHQVTKLDEQRADSFGCEPHGPCSRFCGVICNGDCPTVTIT